MQGSSLSVAAQWDARAERSLLLALGARPDPFTGRVFAPSEATRRRVTAKLDIDIAACLDEERISRWDAFPPA